MGGREYTYRDEANKLIAFAHKLLELGDGSDPMIIRARMEDKLRKQYSISKLTDNDLSTNRLDLIPSSVINDFVLDITKFDKMNYWNFDKKRHNISGKAEPTQQMGDGSQKNGIISRVVRISNSDNSLAREQNKAASVVVENSNHASMNQIQELEPLHHSSQVSSNDHTSNINSRRPTSSGFANHNMTGMRSPKAYAKATETTKQLLEFRTGSPVGNIRNSNTAGYLTNNSIEEMKVSRVQPVIEKNMFITRHTGNRKEQALVNNSNQKNHIERSLPRLAKSDVDQNSSNTDIALNKTGISVPTGKSTSLESINKIRKHKVQQHRETERQKILDAAERNTVLIETLLGNSNGESTPAPTNNLANNHDRNKVNQITPPPQPHNMQGTSQDLRYMSTAVKVEESKNGKNVYNTNDLNSIRGDQVNEISNSSSISSIASSSPLTHVYRSMVQKRQNKIPSSSTPILDQELEAGHNRYGTITQETNYNMARSNKLNTLPMNYNSSTTAPNTISNSNYNNLTPDIINNQMIPLRLAARNISVPPAHIQNSSNFSMIRSNQIQEVGNSELNAYPNNINQNAMAKNLFVPNSQGNELSPAAPEVPSMISSIPISNNSGKKVPKTLKRLGDIIKKYNLDEDM
ncbi:hypothetical protein Kpol_1036p87 [Vanderwaltozyma polyspora DSM 70294]|uniref:Uncharacterized protein n=1 Tax=Vanderwaltozyma polyspora (strain ATCC 22028 / DSM 70294 / BCRC 21397 / CBS 2163 / NBRC 10782 / NRRL Y-8283 / UCD 57-17) TaxID=436907 RepID=A7TEN3_VANPO|nr:uncharacterized protein Kpol_1036p87 [Vanderwaltozyma polyspora DSM 70294]EDO19340.1 hypothetical protein Kpol_1036p87 [Vanderwaltozyma polyspora DSM 70294]